MSNPSLSGLNILVTRPAHLAQPLCTMISSLGGTPYLFPTLEITDTPDLASFHQQIKQLDKMQWCIFISQNAVLKSIPIIKHYWPELPKQLRIAAIGEKTAQCLRNNQITVTCLPTSDFSSESLLTLPEFTDIKQQKIVIIQGEGGREHLINTLRFRGAEVHTAIAYRRQIPTNTSLPTSLSEIDCIVSTSTESLTNLWQLLDNEKNSLCNKKLIVVSERISQYAKKLGFSEQPLVTTQVSDEAIINCLLQWVQ